MSSLLFWSPRWWFGAGECEVWLIVRGGLPAFLRAQRLARFLGAQGFRSRGRVIWCVWPWGCLGAWLFARLVRP